MMTRFDISKTTRSPEEWSAIAFRQTTENNIQWNIAGGLIVAAIAASATTPVTGLLVAAWSLFTNIKKAREIQRNQEVIRRIGCIAHVLDGDNFREYLNQIGSEKIQQELNFAADRGYSFSDDALDYMESLPQAIASVGAVRSLPPQASQTGYSLPPQTNSQSSVHVLDNTIDIVKELTSPVQNCIIFGIGGSGKGMLVANALRRIKAENPNRKIFYIDPKNEPGEYGYTEGVVDVIKRKSCKNKPAQEIFDWFNEVLDDYIKWAAKQEEPLLVIDEGSIAGAAAKKCKNDRIGSLILHISSLGGAAKEKVWLLAQSPFVGPLGIDLNTTSQIVAVTLVSAANTNVLKQWSRSPILEMIDLDRLNELIKASPVGRAVFFGGNSRWGAMPELTNYSDIDRDNNKPTGDALTREQRQSLRTATATQLKPSEVAMIEQLERTKYLTLEDFIIKEMGEGDRLPQFLTAITLTIKKANHKGLHHKFKID